MSSKRWQVWSRDPNSRRWMVVVDGTTEDDARTRADDMMATARKFRLVGAAYVALAPGEQPTAEHADLAVPADDPATPDVSLTGHVVTAEEGAANLRAGAALTFAAPSIGLPDVNDRFAPDALAGVVGRVIPMRLASDQGNWVRITAADVAEDGSSVTLRLELADGPDD